MGVRVQCAKCHNHPFENISQTDYYGLAAFFARVQLKGSEFGRDDEARAVMALDTLTWTGLLPDAPPSTALAAEVLANPTLIPDPRNKATRDGKQTGRLGLPHETAILSLLAAIRAEVERYRVRVGACGDPFARFARANDLDLGDQTVHGDDRLGLL